MLSSQSSINSAVETEKLLQEVASPDQASDQRAADASIDVATELKDLSDLLDGSWLTYAQSLIDGLPEPLAEAVIETHDEPSVEQAVVDHQELQSLTSLLSEDEIVQEETIHEEITQKESVEAAVIDETTEEVAADEADVETAATEEVTVTDEEALIAALDPEIDPDVDFGDNSFLQIFSLNSGAKHEKLVIFGDERDDEIDNWAEQREIHCLLFSIGESKFAAPLITLGHIFEINSASKSKGAIYRVPNLPKWVSGRFQYNKFNSLVLDGYRTLLLNDESHSNPEHVLTFGGGKWGVTCDEVSRAIWVDKEDVQWRKDRSHRPWSCGILVKEMCVLIDIPLLSRTLQFNQK